jgi:hypothetical protein
MGGRFFEDQRRDMMIEPAKNGPPDNLAGVPGGTLRRQFENRARLRRAAARASAGSLFQPLPVWIWVVSGLLAFLGFFTANPVITSFTIMMVPVMASLLWFKGEPPAMLFACLMQWLQASAAVFYCNEYDTPLDRAAGLPEFSSATWLSLIAVLVLAVGMRVALFWRKDKVAEEAAAEAGQLQPEIIFAIYAVAFVFFYFLGKVAYTVPQLTQPLLAFGNVRWALIFLLAYAVLQRGTHYFLLAMVFFFELVFGFLGYFAGFRGIFLMMLSVLPCTRFALRGWRLAATIILGAALIGLSIIWTVIKDEYRDFLNQGSEQQVVTAPIPERIAKLGELLGKVDAKTISAGLNDMILRVSYVNYFALCMKNVPAAIPHEHGKIWLDAIERPFMPRLLFPDKAVLDDSAETEYYTGYQVAGTEQGTSISIGYMGESYVDFGRFGMFAPIFLLGLFYGGIYRYFIRYKHKAMGLAVATPLLLFGIYAVEISCAKLVGGSVVALLVMALFVKICGDWFWRMMTRPVRVKSRRPVKRVEKHG